MNKTLFFSNLVCIFCLSASQFLYDSEDGPQPGPEADRCLNSSSDITVYGCLAPGFKRWHLNETNPESDLHRFCCFIYDFVECTRISVDEARRCPIEGRGATHEFLYQWEAFWAKGKCVKHPRKTEKCIKLD